MQTLNKMSDSIVQSMTRVLRPLVMYILPKPRFQGFVDECSTQHVAGWLYDRLNPDTRVAYEIVLRSPRGEKILGRGIANNFYMALAQQSLGDACYGFQFIFPDPLSAAERDNIVVRPAGASRPLKQSPNLITSFELISYIAMDIVNNCNLRCPFCLFDYSKTKTTRFMSDETFDRALALLPSVRDAGFWLSCLHEPSLHPNFLNMINRIPRQWRHKVMFTTNLAKRMPDSYFQTLAESDFYHINISLESLDPQIFEKLRRGARWPIFKENWDRFVAAWKAAPAPPRIRYIAMAYKSNFRDIPDLIKYLRDERCAWQVEVRYTYDMDHIAADFRETEYLNEADWDWLAGQLGHYPEDEILFIRPLKPLEGDAPALTAKAVEQPNFVETIPAEVLEDFAPMEDITEQFVEMVPAVADHLPAPAAPPVAPSSPATKKAVPLPLNIQIEWNGDMIICGRWSHPSERRLIETVNIRTLDNLYQYLAELAERPLQMIQGYVDEISATMVTGWIRDAYDPTARVEFDVALLLDDETTVIARGRADQRHPALVDSEFGDGRYGFTVELPAPLTAEARNNLVVRPANTKLPLERAPKYQGFVDERSIHHISGWVRNRFDPDERVAFEAVLGTGRDAQVIATGRAERFYAPLAAQFGGAAMCGFRLLFARALTEAERDMVMIRPAGQNNLLELSPSLSTAFGPSEIATPEFMTG